VRILAVCCHPSRDSFHADLRAEVLGRLAADGHMLTVIDLYAEGFDPVVREAEWRHQREPGLKAPEIERHVAELRSAQALLLIYPTWWYGLPAMMKGWLDRVWLPGVAFDIENGRIRRHMLSNIRRFAVVTTHGSPQWFIRLAMGEPGRKQVVRGLTQHLAQGCKVSWNALYGIDTREADALEAWRERTARRLGRFFAG
jgi:putative NADPH-quinone reductase